MELVTSSRLSVGKETWDGFVEQSDEAWLWHCFEFQDALACWPSYSDISFGLLDPDSGGGLLAVVPLHLLAHQSIISLGGPAFPNKIPRKLRLRALSFTRDYLLSMARKYDLHEINISLPPMAPAYSGDGCPRVNPLLEFGCENTLTQTWVVDLKFGKEVVWNRMEGRARTAIRKAVRSGVEVRQAEPNDLETYYRLHTETYHRTGAPPHPKGYFEVIWDNFLAKGLAHILIAECNGEAIAAENFGTYKRRGIYWTGAANAEGLRLDSNSLLQWEAIKYMIENGFEYYETGEAFPGVRAGKEKGLNDFKKSFGGDLYPFYKGRLMLVNSGDGQAPWRSRFSDKLLDLNLRKIFQKIKN